MTKKVVSEKTGTLTDQIDCDWCDAKAGEPCKIQDNSIDHYHLGNLDNPQVLHICRFKKD